jgi:SAM-dependent methyltransferase
MSGFDTRWLNLREPLDRLARDQALLRRAALFAQKSARQVIVDIGSGTGSTIRAIAPLTPDVHWRLIDHDERLLLEAARRHSQNSNIIYQTADLKDLASVRLNETDLVCASAFFDLCSREFVEKLADCLLASASGLYAALNYNGHILFDVPHPDDHLMIQLFNDHQRTDKGFGPAMGPQSTDILEEVLTRLNYHVEIARSDWVVAGEATELHRMFVAGLASAVTETGMLDQDRIAGWLAFRVTQAETTGCRVGHFDVLALPQNASA